MNAWRRFGLPQSPGGVERGVPNISFGSLAQSGMTSFVTFVFFQRRSQALNLLNPAEKQPGT